MSAWVDDRSLVDRLASEFAPFHEHPLLDEVADLEERLAEFENDDVRVRRERAHYARVMETIGLAGLNAYVAVRRIVLVSNQRGLK